METVASIISSISYANHTESEDLSEANLKVNYIVDDVFIDFHRKVAVERSVLCKFYNTSTGKCIVSFDDEVDDEVDDKVDDEVYDT